MISTWRFLFLMLKIRLSLLSAGLFILLKRFLAAIAQFDNRECQPPRKKDVSQYFLTPPLIRHRVGAGSAANRYDRGRNAGLSVAGLSHGFCSRTGRRTAGRRTRSFRYSPRCLPPRRPARRGSRRA